jgi:hypothetical protein
MAFAILLGGIIGLLVAGAVVAIGTAAQKRRDKDDLDVAFAEAYGHDPDSGELAPSTWSSFDMAVLREDGTEVDGHDPFATLIQSSTHVEWHEEPEPNESVPEPVLDHPEQMLEHQEQMLERAEPLLEHPTPLVEHPEPLLERVIAEGNQAIADGHPVLTQAIADGKPVLWQAPGQPPVIILVVGVGFLGAGGGAVAAASQLRKDAFGHTYAPHPDHAHDGNGGSAPDPVFDVEAVSDDITDRESERAATPNGPNGMDAPDGWHDPAANGGEPQRIAWRAPGQLARRQ